jgi:hypothetical protein
MSLLGVYEEVLKVPKSEFFHLFDFNGFHDIKSL